MRIKDRHAKESSFSRALIAGVICGITGAVLIILYNIVFRRMTGFTGLGFIEPSIIIATLPLFMVFAGFVFLGMVEVFKNGEVIFTILALLLTAAAIGFDLVLRGGPVLSGAKGLLLGIALIAGLITSLLLPFLATHPRIFMEKEELWESAKQ